MRWLNYHHLHYFWSVVNSGSVTAASRELGVAQPTVSTQLRALEESLGEPLFEKNGRSLKLTESGKVCFKYASQIFSLGNEMFDFIEGKGSGKSERLRVGVCDVMPKHLVHKLMQPVYALTNTPRIVFNEDSAEKLLVMLAVHDLDLVLSDCPIMPSVQVRAYNHLLGECGVSFLASKELQRAHAKRFPESLDGAPMLLPSYEAAVRRDLDRWFEKQGVAPRIVAEYQDSALMKIAGREGLGIFPVPAVMELELTHELKLGVVGRSGEIRERFYLISTERRIKHGATALICEKAENLFGVAR